VAAAPPAKKPITVDAIRNYQPVEISAPVWAPDGNRFAYITEGKIWIYDLAARRRTSLIATGDLEKLAVPVPPPDTFQWQNRRVRERRIQWTPKAPNCWFPQAAIFSSSTPRTGSSSR
jgi:hypothetical protein